MINPYENIAACLKLLNIRNNNTYYTWIIWIYHYKKKILIHYFFTVIFLKWRIVNEKDKIWISFSRKWKFTVALLVIILISIVNIWISFSRKWKFTVALFSGCRFQWNSLFHILWVFFQLNSFLKHSMERWKIYKWDFDYKI